MTASEPTGTPKDDTPRDDDAHASDASTTGAAAADAAAADVAAADVAAADVAPPKSAATTSADAAAAASTADGEPSILEILVFGPIDAAFSFMRDPRGAATRGRGRVDQALRQARALGELSVRFGAREIRRRTEGDGQDDAAATATPPAAPRPDAGPAPDDVIAGYDALSASQIVPMLTSLEPSERARVAAYEAKARARQTILRRIDQLDEAGG